MSKLVERVVERKWKEVNTGSPLSFSRDNIGTSETSSPYRSETSVSESDDSYYPSAQPSTSNLLSPLSLPSEDLPYYQPAVPHQLVNLPDGQASFPGWDAMPGEAKSANWMSGHLSHLTIDGQDLHQGPSTAHQVGQGPRMTSQQVNEQFWSPHSF
jgi:hypothetical protein